jgi:hypothetical protein
LREIKKDRGNRSDTEVDTKNWEAKRNFLRKKITGQIEQKEESQQIDVTKKLKKQDRGVGHRRQAQSVSR